MRAFLLFWLFRLMLSKMQMYRIAQVVCPRAIASCQLSCAHGIMRAKFGDALEPVGIRPMDTIPRSAMRRHTLISNPARPFRNHRRQEPGRIQILERSPMPRAHKLPTPIIALSPARCAAAIGVNYESVILPAIMCGELGPVYQRGAKRRILIRDLEEWIRTLWLSTPAKRK